MQITLYAFLGKWLNIFLWNLLEEGVDDYWVTILDAFAGAGKFTLGPAPLQTTKKNNDLNYGSPIIAVTTVDTMIKSVLEQSNAEPTKRNAKFRIRCGRESLIFKHYILDMGFLPSKITFL
jgi:hypothetical protein